jgi:hypothetical protein
VVRPSVSPSVGNKPTTLTHSLVLSDECLKLRSFGKRTIHQRDLRRNGIVGVPWVGGGAAVMV